MKSPLTFKDDARLIKRYPTQTVIKLYRDNLNLDVSGDLGNEENIDLYECADSGYRFYIPFTAEGSPGFYERLIKTNYGYYPGWKWENNIASKYIKQGNKVMDVGCGDGTFLDLLAHRVEGVERYGLEFNAEAIAQATAKGLHIFSEPVQQHAVNHKEGYDVATTFQVLEHIADISSFLKAKTDLVKKGGLVIIGVPNNNPYLYRKDKYHVLNLPPHHMGLWGRQSLTSLQHYFPLKLESIHIEPVEDLFYYTFVQLSATGLYSKLAKGSKLFRGAGRLFNKVTSPVARFLNGRNIVAVYRKI